MPNVRKKKRKEKQCPGAAVCSLAPRVRKSLSNLGLLSRMELDNYKHVHKETLHITRSGHCVSKPSVAVGDNALQFLRLSLLSTKVLSDSKESGFFSLFFISLVFHGRTCGERGR